MTTPSAAARLDKPADSAGQLAESKRAAGTEPGGNPIASKEVFLQLLVAQIRHQNPLNPASGTEFVAQLAQFSQLEATLAIRQDLAKIREKLAPSATEGV